VRQGRLALVVVAVEVAAVAGEEVAAVAGEEAGTIAVAGAVAAAEEEVGIVAAAGLGILLRLHRSCRYIEVRLDDEQGTAPLWTHLIFSKHHFCCLAPVLSHR
jgi:hypothetical protein